MKHIFHLITIAFIIYEYTWIMNASDKIERAIKYKHLSKKEKDLDWDSYSDEHKSLLKRYLFLLVFIFWSFIGLFTFNWVAFLIFIVIQFLIIAPLLRLNEYNILYKTIHITNSIFGFLFGIFIILNSYHLKIDLYLYFSELFN